MATTPAMKPMPLDRRVPVVAIYTALALALLSSFGMPATLLLLTPTGWRGPQLQLTVRALWAAIHVLVFVLFPLALARGLGTDALALGLRLPRAYPSAKVVSVVALCAFPLILLFAHSQWFLRAYPMFRVQHLDPTVQCLWLVCMASYLFSIEFFFRGFLPALLKPALGPHALYVALIPYVATHSYLPEALGAVPVGLLLGWLRNRAQSVWPGYVAHLWVAVEIELVALHQQGIHSRDDARRPSTKTSRPCLHLQGADRTKPQQGAICQN